MLCYQFKFVITFNHVKPVNPIIPVKPVNPYQRIEAAVNARVVKPVNPINPANPYQRIEDAVYARVVDVDVAGGLAGADAVVAVALNVHSSYVYLLKNDYFKI